MAARHESAHRGHAQYHRPAGSRDCPRRHSFGIEALRGGCIQQWRSTAREQSNLVCASRKPRSRYRHCHCPPRMSRPESTCRIRTFSTSRRHDARLGVLEEIVQRGHVRDCEALHPVQETAFDTYVRKKVQGGSNSFWTTAPIVLRRSTARQQASYRSPSSSGAQIANCR